MVARSSKLQVRAAAHLLLVPTAPELPHFLFSFGLGRPLRRCPPMKRLRASPLPFAVHRPPPASPLDLSSKKQETSSLIKHKTTKTLLPLAQSLHEALGTHLNFSTAYHPQTDGQTERVNQILEDMLRACALANATRWDKSLPYAEFSYNNSYQASLQMSPFEALYGRACRTPLNWTETAERTVFGPDIIQEAEEQVAMIRERLKIAQSRQKSYADNRRRDLSFEPEDFVYLRVTPLRGVKRFHAKGKLAPRYVGPFKILERRGEVAYQLELPQSLAGVHDVFHVSQLKKCLRVPEEQAPLESIELKEDLTYKEQPVKILDVAERRTRSKTVRFCKVQWSHHSEGEATWECEEELKAEFPSLFSS